MRGTVWSMMMLLATVGAGTLAAEEKTSLIDTNVILQLGGYVVSTDTTVRIDGSHGRGTDFNLEDDLGFEDANRFRFDGLWRISPKHHLRAAWFRLDRDSTRRIDRQLMFDDIVIPVSGEVSGSLDTSIWELAYEYAFIHKPNYEIAGTFGVHAISFDLALSATGANFTTRKSEADTSAPLPVIGVRGLWRLGDAPVYIEASGQYFQATVQNYDGDIQDYRVTLTWMPWRNFGFGAGYEQFKVDANVDEEKFDGHLKWKYGGLTAFATLAF
jgi:hypothetical protein